MKEEWKGRRKEERGGRMEGGREGRNIIRKLETGAREIAEQ